MGKIQTRNILYVGGPFHGRLERKEISGSAIYVSQFDGFPLDTRNAPNFLSETHTYTKLIDGEDFDVWQHQSLIKPHTEAKALDSLIEELMKRRDKLAHRYGI